uniref:ARAD1C20526p n=1 Tax=Blastobotrys adeninivorans TaxID=409370 RepID=A0A060T1Y6_BLAAD
MVPIQTDMESTNLFCAGGDCFDGGFLSLPRDIQNEVIRYLDPDDLYNLLFTSSQLHDFVLEKFWYNVEVDPGLSTVRRDARKLRIYKKCRAPYNRLQTYRGVVVTINPGTIEAFFKAYANNRAPLRYVRILTVRAVDDHNAIVRGLTNSNRTGKDYQRRIVQLFRQFFALVPQMNLLRIEMDSTASSIVELAARTVPNVPIRAPSLSRPLACSPAITSRIEQMRVFLDDETQLTRFFKGHALENVQELTILSNNYLVPPAVLSAFFDQCPKLKKLEMSGIFSADSSIEWIPLSVRILALRYVANIIGPQFGSRISMANPTINKLSISKWDDFLAHRKSVEELTVMEIDYRRLFPLINQCTSLRSLEVIHVSNVIDKWDTFDKFVSGLQGLDHLLLSINGIRIPNWVFLHTIQDHNPGLDMITIRTGDDSYETVPHLPHQLTTNSRGTILDIQLH